jgi:NAD(P)-dependent dehydrogenase (short-subunit alcohol dehydrogenase family)
MNSFNLHSAYDFAGKTIAITGGGGVLCGAMARAVAECNANVVLLDRDPAAAERVLATLQGTKGRHSFVAIDVLDVHIVQSAAKQVIADYGHVYGLINGAGGNNPKATTSPEQTFFDIAPLAFQVVSELNLLGTVVPSQAFGKYMAAQKQGVILNISSMNALRPLTRIPAYSAAKAAVSNFTQWLAVHLAQEYSPEIRVNALAPGFFLTEQNRFLLKDRETGNWTTRGQTILNATPMARFGTPEDLLGATLWLLSEASRFVTGIVVPVDGGFSAYSGV